MPIVCYISSQYDFFKKKKKSFSCVLFPHLIASQCGLLLCIEMKCTIKIYNAENLCHKVWWDTFSLLLVDSDNESL